MKIELVKYTDVNLAREACEFTMHNPQSSKMSLEKLYQCEHSPMRTQMFFVKMYDIPNFVSVHFVRHKIGVEHFVQTNRLDRGADDIANRLTPTNHAMWCNAQSLICMARKRLCYKASKETRDVMLAICEAVADVDYGLYEKMVPECVYRGMICHEMKMCGKMAGVVHCSEKQGEDK